MAFRMLRNQTKDVREMVQIQKIHNEEWTTYFTQMYKADINQLNNNNMMKVNDINVEISEEEVEKILRSLKNRKSPCIAMPMFKEGGGKIEMQV
jgi:Ca2+-binding EF-hand superfamily protein